MDRDWDCTDCLSVGFVYILTGPFKTDSHWGRFFTGGPVFSEKL